MHAGICSLLLSYDRQTSATQPKPVTSPSLKLHLKWCRTYFDGLPSSSTNILLFRVEAALCLMFTCFSTPSVHSSNIFYLLAASRAAATWMNKPSSHSLQRSRRWSAVIIWTRGSSSYFQIQRLQSGQTRDQLTIIITSPSPHHHCPANLETASYLDRTVLDKSCLTIILMKRWIIS